MPSEDVERLLRGFLQEMKEESRGERTTIQGMFNNVLAAVHDLRTHVDTQIGEVRQEVKGVQARVVLLESDRKRSVSPPSGAISAYKKSEVSGTYHLTDFELHDIHNELGTWRSIKSFTRAAVIPAVTFLLIGLLVFIGVHIWVK